MGRKDKIKWRKGERKEEKEKKIGRVPGIKKA